MSAAVSPITNRNYGLKLVCKAWDLCRSAYYARRHHREGTRTKRGPKPKVSDEELLDQIRDDLAETVFKGEGHRKVHARLRRAGTRVGRSRVLTLMRHHNLLSPHRKPSKAKNSHKGRICTDAPNQMWATDGVKIFTFKDGWVWGFPVVDHWNAECLGFHVAKKGDRFAALVPLSQALHDRFGRTNRGATAGSGLKLRVDNGSQYRAEDFRNQVKNWGIQTEYGFVRQPQTNGVVERFNRTFKEQVVHGVRFETLASVKEAVRAFVDEYNEKWLLGKLDYRSPREAMEAWNEAHAA